MFEENMTPEYCMIDNHHGVYIPQKFAELYVDNALPEWHNIRNEDIQELLEGPSADWYWEAWTNVLDHAEREDGKRLHQDGDLWVVNVE